MFAPFEERKGKGRERNGREREEKGKGREGGKEDAMQYDTIGVMDEIRQGIGMGWEGRFRQSVQQRFHGMVSPSALKENGEIKETKK